MPARRRRRWVCSGRRSRSAWRAPPNGADSGAGLDGSPSIRPGHTRPQAVDVGAVLRAREIGSAGLEVRVGLEIQPFRHLIIDVDGGGLEMIDAIGAHQPLIRQITVGITVVDSDRDLARGLVLDLGAAGSIDFGSGISDIAVDRPADQQLDTGLGGQRALQAQVPGDAGQIVQPVCRAALGVPDGEIQGRLREREYVATSCSAVSW